MTTDTTPKPEAAEKAAHYFDQIDRNFLPGHLGTARDGKIEVIASAVHMGCTTQVWDAIVSHKGKTIALFRCTQMILFPKKDT